MLWKVPIKIAAFYIINSMPQRVSTEFLKEKSGAYWCGTSVSQVEQARKDIIEIVKQMQSEEIIKLLNFANEPRLT